MQEQPDELSKILFGAIQADEKIRRPAEEEIQKLTNNNFSLFLFELSKRQADEKMIKPIRQLSATLIKNIIKDNQEKWLNLDINSKEQIKNNILSTLISPDIDIKKAAGLCISGICKVELPNNQWNNIFENLINAAQNENKDIKITALLTLGYIYEEIPLNVINSDTITKLVNMYYNILSQIYDKENDKDMALITQCLGSIKRFVPFLEDIISNDNSRLVFFNMIKTYMLHSNEEIRSLSIRIFNDLLGCYYRFFQNYIDTLFEVLFQIIEKDNEANKKYAFDLIYTIAEIETNLINLRYNTTSNFFCLDKYRDKLGEVLLKNIMTDNFEDEEYSLTKYCCVIIGFLCQCCDFKFTEKMITFYKNNISSDNGVIKFAAINIFRSILETREKEKIFPLVNDSLPMLSTILLDKQTMFSVRKLIAHTIKTIIENFGFLIIKDESLFNKFMILFLNLLNDSPPKITLLILRCVTHLVKQVKTDNFLPSNMLSQYAKSYYEILLNLAQNINLFDHDVNIPMNALYALGTYGQHVANDVNTISFNVFKSVLEMFSKTLNKGAFADDKIRLNYQEYICSCLNSFLMNRKAQERDVRNLFNYLIESFQERKEIYEEGISLVGVIAKFLQRGFMTEMNRFSPFLLLGLNSTNCFDLCKSSFLCLSEIIAYTQSDFNIYVEEYLKVIMKILVDNSINRELKPKCLNIISDLFLNCKEEVFKYFNDIMKMMGGAFEACQMEFTEKDNLDFINYIVELKEYVLETMSCIFNSVEDMNKTNEFVPYAKYTIEFINKILRDEANLSNEILRSSLGLIADFCRVYGKNVYPILDVSLLKDKIERFKRNKENMENEQLRGFILWVQNEISHVVISN